MIHKREKKKKKLKQEENLCDHHSVVEPVSYYPVICSWTFPDPVSVVASVYSCHFICLGATGLLQSLCHGPVTFVLLYLSVSELVVASFALLPVFCAPPQSAFPSHLHCITFVSPGSLCFPLPISSFPALLFLLLPPLTCVSLPHSTCASSPH